MAEFYSGFTSFGFSAILKFLIGENVKNWIHEGILWATVTISGILVDVFLSYNIYLKDPDYFIANEANREFVNFLTRGSIPFSLIAIILVFIILSTSFSRLRLLSIKFRLPCRIILWFFACSYLISRCSAGSSWYVTNFYDSWVWDLHEISKYGVLVGLITVGWINLFAILGGMKKYCPNCNVKLVSITGGWKCPKCHYFQPYLVE